MDRWYSGIMTACKAVDGSSILPRSYGVIVKWLSQGPVTSQVGVQFSLIPNIVGYNQLADGSAHNALCVGSSPTPTILSWLSEMR